MDQFTLTYDGKRYVAMTEAELLTRGVPQATILEATTAARLATIKTVCQRRIYDVLSAETQANIASAAAVIGSVAEADRTTEQTAMLAAASEMVDWIASMRAAVQTLAADAGADYTQYAAWPECPATVIALAADY
ncbi:hypothetical protein [uncultured Cohaesibacter sp.]|uniref:hypothetical protein n=1 Tax=uncultured Cohaesibacter sp. TaxID=1002546 RepID=UPI002AAB0812|nr:hypothetical protein [uncultured Cohaesibacter sp.]